MRAGTDPAASRPWPQLLTLAPFLLLAILFAGTDLLAMQRVSQLRSEAEAIEKDMLTDIELVSRMQGELDHVKVLADEHVFEKRAEAMASLEARIAKTQADIDVAANEYQSMPMLPGEEAPWQAFQAALSDLRPRLSHALALSRRNQDELAYNDLTALQGDFDGANESLHALIEFNRRTAHGTYDRVAALHRSSTTSLQLLAVAGVGLLLVVGVAMTRALQQSNLQLRHSVDRLEESNRELDAFADRVAHDLRAPLTTATLATARLLRQSPSSDHAKSFDALHRAFGRMGGIIQDLLAISRVDIGETASEGDPVAAAAQLREELGPRVDRGDVSLVIDVQPAKVRCSEGLLRQVMWNLTDNAIKYRRADAHLRIEVRGRAAQSGYELSVRDNGLGISGDQTDKVFEPFYRADSPHGRRRRERTNRAPSRSRREVQTTSLPR